MTDRETPAHVHLITPGDHFSPGTGSAIPTVVHGLAGATPLGSPRPAVLVDRETYSDRYRSAAVLEYDARRVRPNDRALDLLAGRCGLRRPGEQRVLAAALAPLRDQADSIVLAHNAPQAAPLIEARHTAVVYAHNQLFRTYSRRESRRVLARVGRIVCVSNYLAEDTARLLPTELRSRLRVVHNGVDTAHFSRARVPRDGHLRVTFLGRVVPDKGVHVLLEAVRLLGRRDIEVTVAGRPGFDAGAPLSAYEQRLRRLAAQLRPRTRFASFVPRHLLPELLATTDVLVVPSMWPEPFGLTALEGMAAGAAVVTSRIGGLPEAVGRGGILVPPGDAHALADVLSALAENDSTLRGMQYAARVRAAEMSWASVHSRLIAALEDAI